MEHRDILTDYTPFELGCISAWTPGMSLLDCLAHGKPRTSRSVSKRT